MSDKQNEPLWITAVCLDCEREWQSVCPDGLESDYLQCPKCLLFRGVEK